MDALRNDNQNAAMVFTARWPVSVFSQYVKDKNGEKFQPDEEPFTMVQYEGTWTSKRGDGHCPMSYVEKTFNNGQSYVMLSCSHNYWLCMVNAHISYCEKKEELTFEAVKMRAKNLVHSTKKNWVRA